MRNSNLKLSLLVGLSITILCFSLLSGCRPPAAVCGDRPVAPEIRTSPAAQGALDTRSRVAPDDRLNKALVDGGVRGR